MDVLNLNAKIGVIVSTFIFMILSLNIMSLYAHCFTAFIIRIRRQTLSVVSSLSYKYSMYNTGNFRSVKPILRVNSLKDIRIKLSIIKLKNKSIIYVLSLVLKRLKNKNKYLKLVSQQINLNMIFKSLIQYLPQTMEKVLTVVTRLCNDSTKHKYIITTNFMKWIRFGHWNSSRHRPNLLLVFKNFGDILTEVVTQFAQEALLTAVVAVVVAVVVVVYFNMWIYHISKL
ncbi:hypothetical protein AGLY_014289 [Aphis glycines]|uniref:Uncharacterized protein n=1 Tax=Aphis glycines TaxID=307491 RepID=A0A6G0T5N0_APHGL|nr:hypothetical protein AGLY_014289 [Aphis glycines]